MPSFATPSLFARRGGLMARFVAVQRVTGILLMVFSLTMLPPLAIAIALAEDTVIPLLAGLGITLVTGAAIWIPARTSQTDLKTRDGFLITVLFWTVLGLFGAIPLYFAGQGWHSATDAIFESISGLTTTGATTIAQGLDVLPKSLNYYRAQLHWLGGMGIIVLAVAVLPMLGIGGMQLYRAETPGPMKNSKLTPRITETARVLWLLYASLTAICGVAYWLAGMSPFDAVCHAMSTLSTGGFSTHDASIGHYHSLTIEVIAIVFMMIGAANFALHFTAWQTRSLRAYLLDSEFAWFIGVFLVFSVLIVVPLYLHDVYPTFGAALRYGVFTLVAYASTAGFGIVDPTPWPSYLPLLLLLSAFMFSCSGSTGGGVKVVRLALFILQALREMTKLVHPSAELLLKFDGRVVPNQIVYAVGGFFSMYVGLTIVLTFAMIATGMDAVTAFSAISASLNNMGPGVNEIATNVSTVSLTGKWIMILAMLLGRLEIFTLLVIFTPAFWRR